MANPRSAARTLARADQVRLERSHQRCLRGQTRSLRLLQRIRMWVGRRRSQSWRRRRRRLVTCEYIIDFDFSHRGIRQGWHYLLHFRL
jgi:hypothetical protein